MKKEKASKKSILLIDDDRVVLQTITKLLEKEGYFVRPYQDAREAIKDASQEDFDLVITDIRMPHIDGFETIRYMREMRYEQQKPAVPEILITGYSEDYAEKAGALKPHALVFKPFNLNEFLNIVKTAFER